MTLKEFNDLRPRYVGNVPNFNLVEDDKLIEIELCLRATMCMDTYKKYYCHDIHKTSDLLDILKIEYIQENKSPYKYTILDSSENILEKLEYYAVRIEIENKLKEYFKRINEEAENKLQTMWIGSIFTEAYTLLTDPKVDVVTKNSVTNALNMLY